jgi:thioredoxin reductase (NADPH)
MDKSIKYYNALASLVDRHTIKVIIVYKLVDNKGKETTVTSKYICIAVGGRPLIPNELSHLKDSIMTSDDIFMRKTAPGKTLVIGASYVALECAGFLKGLGYDVTVMVRSILLR